MNRYINDPIATKQFLNLRAEDFVEEAYQRILRDQTLDLTAPDDCEQVFEALRMAHEYETLAELELPSP